MTGYETYTKEERAEMIKRIESDLRQEKWASEGNDLRAEIAQANVREFERTIKKIRKTK